MNETHSNTKWTDKTAEAAGVDGGGAVAPASQERCESRHLLDGFIRQLLWGPPPEDESIPDHLEQCRYCSELFVQLVDLLTATLVVDLQDALLSAGGLALPAVAGAEGKADQLFHHLRLWRLYLATSLRLGEAQRTAFALSALGMTHRALGQRASWRGDLATAASHYEQAAFVHERARRAALRGGDLQALAMSHADLGYLQLVLGAADVEEARYHYQAALDAVARAGESFADPEGEATRARIKPLVMIASLVGQMRAQAASIAAVRRGLAESLMECLQPPVRFVTTALAAQQIQRSAPRGLGSATEQVLVANTLREVPLEIRYGPVLNARGFVTVRVELDPNNLGVDIRQRDVRLDMLFMLTSPPQLLGSFRITQARETLQAELRGVADYLGREGAEGGRELIFLPRRAFAFRMWWKEEDDQEGEDHVR